MVMVQNVSVTSNQDFLSRYNNWNAIVDEKLKKKLMFLWKYFTVVLHMQAYVCSVKMAPSSHVGSLYLTNSMQQIPYTRTDSHSLVRLLYNSEVHDSLNKSSPLHPFLGHINPVPTFAI
jgi:hypothetical protein